MENIKRPETMERITTPALAEAFIEEQVAQIRAQVGDKKVLLALSGGVDSSVVAALLIRAIGSQLVCVHVNHGLLRKGEPEQVVEVFRDQMKANLVYVDAADRFLDKLAGVEEPEKKRKIIGVEFIRVFEEEARKLEGIEFLAQGTIYPDVIESGSGDANLNEEPSEAPAVSAESEYDPRKDPNNLAYDGNGNGVPDGIEGDLSGNDNNITYSDGITDPGPIVGG